MSDTQKQSTEINQLNALDIELKCKSEELARVKEELKEESELRRAVELMVERYLESANENPEEGKLSDELDKEIKQLREIIASTKAELKDVYTQKNGVEQLLEKYLEGFGSFEAVSRLTSLIEFNPEAIVALDINGLVLDWNPSAERMFGWKKEEIIGKYYPIVSGEHKRSFESIHARVMHGQKIRTQEAIRKTKDGKLLDVSISSMPIKNENDEIVGSSTIITDLTVFKKRADLANRLAAVVEQSPNMIMITDRNQVIEYVNLSFVDVTGYSANELIGQKASILKSDKTPDSTFKAMGKALSKDDSFQGELINKKKNGEYFIISCLISPLQSEKGKITHYVSIQEDLTEISKLKKELSYKSYHDSLTGLHNEQSFKDHINQLIIKAKGESTEHAIAIIDLDDFELVNTNCGAKAGDALIKKTGGIIKSNVKSSDVVARMGRDIYGILVQDLTLQQAQQQIELIRESIHASKFEYRKQIYNITASIGLIQVNEETESVEAVIVNAESACCIAKEQGKNRTVIFSESHNELEKRHGEMELVKEIIYALDNDELFLLWQPIVSLNDNDMPKCYEVLVNMRRQAGKEISANNLLLMAEKYGLSPRIDLWVIEDVLSALDKNVKILDQIDTFTINLSDKSVDNPEIQRHILENIDSSDVPPPKLCFEIGEKIATSGMPEVNQFIYALKDRGCKASVQNYGTRISSFSYLTSLPFDYLKIDRSFIKNIVGSEIDRVFVKSINNICHAMGKETIAEYVDDNKILEELRKIGIDFVQGRAIRSPEPLENIVL